MITESEVPRMRGVEFWTGTGERRELLLAKTHKETETEERSVRSWLSTSGLGYEIMEIISYAFFAMRDKTTYLGKCGHTDYHWHDNTVKIVYIPNYNNGDIPEFWHGRDAREVMQAWMSYRNLWGGIIPSGGVTVGLHFEGNTVRVNRRFTFLAYYKVMDHASYNDGTIFMRISDLPRFFGIYEVQRWRGHEFFTVDLDYASVLELSFAILKASKKDAMVVKFLKNHFFWPRRIQEIKRYHRFEEFSHIYWR